MNSDKAFRPSWQKQKPRASKRARLELCVDQDYLAQAESLIRSAKKSIDILAYSFAIGSAAGKINSKSAPFQIAQSLIRKKEKSKDAFRLRVYLERKRDTSERNRVTAQFLKGHGAEIVYGATHAKGLCIDGKALLIGSTNLSHQSIEYNFEANLLIRDPKTVKQFLRYFEHLIANGKHGEIVFSIYFFNHAKIEKALVQAVKRGVNAIGIIHDHRSFALPYIWANHATVKRLKKSGVNSLVWGNPSLFSHSKYLVIDRNEFALGTGNWLLEDVNVHPQLYLHYRDSRIAKQLVKHLGKQIEFASQ